MMPELERPDVEQSPLLQLEGFEGPLDLLLDLARRQKVDLARISILSLVEQYLAVVEGARRIRLELAADWLVMAAWLAWLKSRLLLPPGTDEAADAGLAADTLASRLRDLQAVRAGAAWLSARPQLGRDVFARGMPERLREFDRSRLAADMPGLMRGYLAAARRAGARQRYRPRRLALWSVQDALVRLEALLGGRSGWTALEQVLPPHAATPLQQRAALASALLAGMELARGGLADIRQDQQFGPILLRADA
jgi:segregation and condensation protein A